MIYNGSSQDLYVSYVAGITTASFGAKIPPGFWATMPWGSVYTGIIYGLLASADPGTFVQVTELVN